MKVGTALCITTLSMALVYLTGFFAGAKADSPSVWLVSFVITLAGATTFALFGALDVARSANSASCLWTGLPISAANRLF